MPPKKDKIKKDYTKLKNTAHELYMQGKTQKEIAQKLEVTEKTIGDWVEKYGWKKTRNAKIVNPKARTENIGAIIDLLSERRIKLFTEIDRLESIGERNEAQMLMLEAARNEAASIDDSVSKWNKTLENLDKENKVSLSLYLHVMDDIFDHLRVYDMDKYRDTIDFQSYHLQTVTNRLG